ncbi:MAG: hypothetical protein U5K00_01055 [Melioribacteraceae bacterium]|nr:hypothetical protein [Melioribacteraceae bacterium]
MSDSTVQNGFTYFYALVAFDRGYEVGEILPSESPFSITVKNDGTTVTSQNVIVAIPEAPVAGYVPATLGEVELIKGATTAKVGYEIVDPFALKEGHKYYITFEDTLKPAFFRNRIRYSDNKELYTCRFNQRKCFDL